MSRWLKQHRSWACALVVGCWIAFAAGPALAQGHHHSGHQDGAADSTADDPHAGHLPAAPTADESLSEVAIPDVPVTTADGREVAFFSDLVEGKTVAINFVFTTCTTICPPMGANFARLQKELGERGRRDVQLISVSVDPVTDTPDRMRAWGEKFGAAPGWTLVTGERTEITRLLRSLEVYTADILEHSPVVLVGNEPSGVWTRAYGLAPPARLSEILDEVSSSKPSEGAR